LLPSWASTGDRADILRLLAENDIREISEIERCLNNGRVRAQELLRKYEQQVHRLAARLIERRRMSAYEFEHFMRAVDT